MKKLLSLVTLILSTHLISNDYLIIDVRTPGEYRSGYIENAINISTILISTVMILADPRNNVAECPIVKPVIA